MGAFLETASLFKRAAVIHSQLLAPVAENMVPPQYAGKTETTCAVMAMDVLGVGINDVSDAVSFGEFVAGLNLVIRANDEVVDETTPYVDQRVTEDLLNKTPVFHRFAGPEGRYVTGDEGMGIVLDAIARLIPGRSVGSIRRRNIIEDMLRACTTAAADTANNPAYHSGVTLDFPTTLKVKDETNGFLGQTCIEVLAAIFDIPGTSKERQLFGQMGVALQFGDDWFDWRRDRAKYVQRSTGSERRVRPLQNLFIATQSEFDDEWRACGAVLADTSRRSIQWARKLAPDACRAFRSRLMKLWVNT